MNTLVWMMMLAMTARGAAASLPSFMPEELSNVHIGMSTDELLMARPNIMRMGMMGAAIDLKAPSLFLNEKLPRGGNFISASFTVEAGKLTSAMLMGNPKRGEESVSRRKFVKECIARWGKDFRKRVPKDALRPGEVVPTLTWERGDEEYVLMLPKNRKKGDTKINAIILQVRALAAGKKEPWKEDPMNDTQKKSIFEAHDVSDK